MKNKLIKTLALLVLVPSLVSCDEGQKTNINTTTSNVDYSSNDNFTYLGVKAMNVVVPVGTTKQLDLYTLPNAYASNLRFESSDTTIATVSNSGVVNGVKAGQTTVKITSTDNKVNQTVNIYITKEISDSDLTIVKNNIISGYTDGSYVAPTSVNETSFISEVYYKKNASGQYVKDHGSESVETIQYDAEDGYFKVDSDDLYLKCENGTVEKSSGKWIFYVVSNSITRMMHITKTSKKYIDLQSGSYVQEPNFRKKIISDILNLFFVSGDEIVNSALDYYEGKSVYSSIFSDSNVVYSATGTEGLAMDYDYISSGTVTADDELHNYFDIPAETNYSETGSINFFYEGSRCPGRCQETTYSYTLNNVPYKRTMIKDMYLSSTFTKEKYDITEHDKKGFELVDNIYDL